MNKKMKSILASMICLMMLVTASASAQECGDYEVTVIAGPQCGDHLTSVFPQAISENGEVVGYTSCNWFQQAFLWTPEDGLQSIPMPDGTVGSQAIAISGSKIVGNYDNPQLELGKTGFLYDYQTKEFTSLGTLEGGNWSEAHDINSSGQITGFWGNNQIGPWQAFIWEDGKMIDLGPSIGGANNKAFGINENGAITGWFGEAASVDSNAFIWDDKVTELPFIPGGFTSEGWALNNEQNVAGLGRMVDPRTDEIVRRAFVWIDGQMFLLGTLPGFPNSTATGINSDRTVVGFTQSVGTGAFLWQDGEISDLNDLVPPSENLDIQLARGINQAGQIATQAHSDALDATVGVIISQITGPLGDLNNDCQVTTADLLLLLGSWGACDECISCSADLDENCTVSTSDLLILLSNWGQ